MILNEKLFNNRILTEKFSDSMPKWLQSRLLFFKAYDDEYGYSAINKRNNYGDRGFDMANQFNPNLNYRINYRDQSGYGNRGDKESLFSQLKKKGLDLDSATFIEGPVPTSSRDPRLKEPNIPIYLLQGTNPYRGKSSWEHSDGGKTQTQVYIPGINDNERFIFSSDAKLLKNATPKELLQYCIAFCYIDGSDKNNFTTNDKRVERQDYHAWERTPGSRRYPEKERKKRRWDYSWTGYGKEFDKSGYIIDPDILQDRLYKNKAKFPDKYLDKIYRRLVNIKNDFSQIYADMDVSDSENQDFLDVFSGSLNSDLIYLIKEYNKAVKRIDNILNDDSKTPEAKERLINNVFTGDIASIESEILKLEKRAENVLSVDLDWD